MVILQVMMLLQNQTPGDEEPMAGVQCTTVIKANIGWHAVTDESLTQSWLGLELELRTVHRVT